MRATCVTIAALMLTLLSGCSAVPWEDDAPRPDRIADVYLHDADGETIVVRVEASGHADVRLSIKHMQNEDYSSAIDLLDAVTEAKPDDDRAWFALGVCHEALGDLEAAHSAYKRANIAKSDVKYQEARIRVESLMM